MKKIIILIALLSTFVNDISAQQIAPSGTYGAANSVTVNNLQVNWVLGNLIPVSLSALPVKLISFTGQLDSDGNAVLEWRTAEEFQNKGFEIQKSTNAISFHSIGWVDGVGNSKAEKLYRFTDTALTTTSYYRLLQMDFDKHSSLSRIISVVPRAESLDQLMAYPNPSQNGLMKLRLPRKTTSLQIFDQQGTLILEQSNPIEEQPIQLLQTGLYHLSIRTPIGTRVLKVVWK